MDLAAAPLRVESALVVVKGRQFATSEPRSRAGRRTLHLPADAIAVLAEPARAQAARAACAAELWQDHGYVFTTGVGTPVQPSRVIASFHWFGSDRNRSTLRRPTGTEPRPFADRPTECLDGAPHG